MYNVIQILFWFCFLFLFLPFFLFSFCFLCFWISTAFETKKIIKKSLIFIFAPVCTKPKTLKCIMWFKFYSGFVFFFFLSFFFPFVFSGFRYAWRLIQRKKLFKKTLIFIFAPTLKLEHDRHQQIFHNVGLNKKNWRL